MEAGAEGVEVEFDDVGGWGYCVGGEEDVLVEKSGLVWVFVGRLVWQVDGRSGTYLCFL